MNFESKKIIPIDYCFNFFSGFMQNNGSPGSGMVQIEALAHQITCGLPNTRVNLFPWDVDEESVAEWLWRYRPENRPQVHLIGSYSYGSDRAIKFMNALLKRSDPSEVQIRHFGSCDGVRRFDLAPGIAAATGTGKLVVPANVENVFWYRQENSRWGLRREPFQPAGHELINSRLRKQRMDDKRSWTPKPIPSPVIRQATHSYIDNDISFRSAILSKVIELDAEARVLWDAEKHLYPA